VHDARIVSSGADGRSRRQTAEAGGSATAAKSIFHFSSLISHLRVPLDDLLFLRDRLTVSQKKPMSKPMSDEKWKIRNGKCVFLRSAPAVCRFLPPCNFHPSGGVAYAAQFAHPAIVKFAFNQFIAK
jgi:hypothetical protein